MDAPDLGTDRACRVCPLAEKTELIRPLSLWVVEAAIKQAKQWRENGHHFKVAINVSPSDLEGPTFTNRLIEMLDRFQLEGSALEIEFTEGALIRNLTEVRLQLKRMRTFGIDIAIDDFGTGYSNWTYLKELPATSVKLDRSLIKDIQNQEKDRRLVTTLIDLAQRLGYKVVAEGIENQANFNSVKAWGCSEGQGFFISPPLAGQALMQWLALDGAAQRFALDDSTEDLR